MNEPHKNWPVANRRELLLPPPERRVWPETIAIALFWLGSVAAGAMAAAALFGIVGQ